MSDRDTGCDSIHNEPENQAEEKKSICETTQIPQEVNNKHKVNDKSSGRGANEHTNLHGNTAAKAVSCSSKIGMNLNMENTDQDLGSSSRDKRKKIIVLPDNEPACITGESSQESTNSTYTEDCVTFALNNILETVDRSVDVTDHINVRTTTSHGTSTFLSDVHQDQPQNDVLSSMSREAVCESHSYVDMLQDAEVSDAMGEEAITDEAADDIEPNNMDNEEDGPFPIWLLDMLTDEDEIDENMQLLAPFGPQEIDFFSQGDGVGVHHSIVTLDTESSIEESETSDDSSTDTSTTLSLTSMDLTSTETDARTQTDADGSNSPSVQRDAEQGSCNEDAITLRGDNHDDTASDSGISLSIVGTSINEDYTSTKRK